MYYPDNFIKMVKGEILKINISPEGQKHIHDALDSQSAVLGDYLKQLLRPPTWAMINKAFKEHATGPLFKKSEDAEICQKLLNEWVLLQRSQEETIRPGMIKYPFPGK